MPAAPAAARRRRRRGRWRRRRRRQVQRRHRLSDPASGVAPSAGRVAEEVLEAVAALLDPDERQAEVDDRVADEVVRPVVRRAR